MQTEQTKMNKNFRRFLPFVLCAFLLAFYSCEYEDNETNYHRLSTPGDTEVDINLAGVSDNSLIYIYAPTRFTYELVPEGKKLVEQKYYLDGVLVGAIEDGTIRIAPVSYDDQEHTLRIEVKATSGTGSLAEKLEIEQYVSNKEFKLKYVALNFKVEIGQRIAEDGHLELFWNDATEDGLEVEHYEVHKVDWYNTEEVLAATVTETSFKDKDYVYGTAQYRIVPKYRYDRVTHPGSGYYTVESPVLSTDKITYSISGNKMLIDLTGLSEYPAKYVIKWNDGTTFNLTENTIEIDAPNFPGGNGKYTIYVLPVTKEFGIYESAHQVPAYAEYPKISQTGKIVADIVNNQLYVVSPYADIYKYDALTMEPLADSHKLENISGILSLAVSSNGRIAAYNNHRIDIYRNNNFDEIVTGISITDDKISSVTPIHEFEIGVVTDNEARIYNPTNGAKVRGVESENDGTKFTISGDGKYVCGIKRNLPDRIRLYREESGGMKVFYNSDMQNHGVITKVWFNQLNSSQLVLQIIDNTFLTFDIESGIFSSEPTEGTFSGFDPYTGNAVYLSTEGEAVILSPSLDEELFRIMLHTANWEDNPQLINNFLIKDYYYLNLATQLQK